MKLPKRFQGYTSWPWDYDGELFTAGQMKEYGAACAKAALDDLLKAQAREAKLRTALDIAADCISDWGAYAPEYFQNKWNLDRDIQAARDATAMPWDDTALREYGKQQQREVLLEAAEWFSKAGHGDGVVQYLRYMAEEIK